jgi:hypothetical protein
LQAMKRMSRRRLSGSSATGLALAKGMVAILTGQPADEAARPLQRALTSMGPSYENWDALAALWWCLLTAERFDAVAAALESAVSKPSARVARAGWWRSTAPSDCCYLSIKTVEGHLARAYSKLDITTRSELDRVFESEKARVPTL